MKEIIEALIRFEQKYKVTPFIRFQHEIGCEYVVISFEKGRKRIDRMFYFVPVGDGTDKNFDMYNPEVDVVIEKAIEELLNAVGKETEDEHNL